MSDRPNAQGMVVVHCQELEPNLQFFITRLGFRIDSITPADNPKRAIISGLGIRLQLVVVKQGQDFDKVTLRLVEKGVVEQVLEAPNGTRVELVDSDKAVEPFEQLDSLTITQASNGSQWITGRAGMRYRDLIPGRIGGRYIASNIHIPTGGEVPDYVHYHRVQFQMIFCKAGWVRVVYEDQGDPFVLYPGDCVLQPPEIRHRVLECSDNLQVIEIGGPAEHDTFAEHHLTLPTSCFRPDRRFSGQLFVHYIANQVEYSKWVHEGFEVKDTGIAAATSGMASVLTVRGQKGATINKNCAKSDLYFVYVLYGKLQLNCKNNSISTVLGIDDCVAVSGNREIELTSISNSVELLVVENSRKAITIVSVK